MATSDKGRAAVFGAYLADAAALGWHWMYDPAKIAAAGAPLAFRTPSAEDFADTKSGCYHLGKRAGDASQYGAQMRAMTRALCGGAYDRGAYQREFVAAFAPGGWWHGYIDKATRGTLAGLAEDRWPSGADDNQIPALSKLAPLMAVGATPDAVADAVAVTHANDVAAGHAVPAAVALGAAMAGYPMADALKAAAAAAEPSIGAALEAAMARAGEDPVTVGGDLGRACSLPSSLPLSFQILARAGSYRQAVEDNIRVGGDNCGRAIFVGAVAGAVFGEAGFPLAWTVQLQDSAVLLEEISAL